jgi:hypothetical protein
VTFTRQMIGYLFDRNHLITCPAQNCHMHRLTVCCRYGAPRLFNACEPNQAAFSTLKETASPSSFAQMRRSKSFKVGHLSLPIWVILKDSLLPRGISCCQDSKPQTVCRMPMVSPLRRGGRQDIRRGNITPQKSASVQEFRSGCLNARIPGPCGVSRPRRRRSWVE